MATRLLSAKRFFKFSLHQQTPILIGIPNDLSLMAALEMGGDRTKDGPKHALSLSQKRHLQIGIRT
jgi:hypothetical protein